MLPVTRLRPQPWMTSEQTVRLMDALESQGITARFVGGCVRDAYLGRPVFDIDIAVDVSPSRIIEALTSHEIHCIPTGIDHGTITAVISHKSFQITSLRKDVETYGRQAKVEFVDDWREDAHRRDFTINALYADRNGYILDPCGTGIEDLRKGIVRFIGNPLQRIEEDALRILRFFRFTAHYAKGTLDPLGLKACISSLDKLTTLSAERVAIEFWRLFSAYNIVPILETMEKIGVLKTLFPFGENFPIGISCLRHLHTLEQTFNKETSPFNRMAALFYGGGGNFLPNHLKFSKQYRQVFELLLLLNQTQKDFPSPFQIKKWLYLHGPSFTQDYLLLNGALQLLNVKMDLLTLTQKLQPILDNSRDWRHAVFPLKGSDIIALGIEPSPKITLYMDQIRDWWIENDFSPTKEECLSYFSTIVKTL